MGGARVARVEWDGLTEVVTQLATGEVIRTEKLLCALGRVANLDGLHIEAAGLANRAWAHRGRRALPDLHAAHLRRR